MDNVHSILQRVEEGRLIAIVRGLPPEHMLPLVEALAAGGLSMVEVTFAQARPETWTDTAASIRSINQRFGEAVQVGAGTVMSVEQVRRAAEAGARYIISPNVDADVIAETRRLELASFPGALTPTEITEAYRLGANAVKVFPAGTLGAGYIKALKAPLAHIPLMAVGGVNERNAADFLKAGAIGLGVGGNLVNKEWIEQGAWDKITALARAYREAVSQ